MKLPDSLLENYEIGAKIGAGGMGAIFKAYHRRLDRMAAIKVLSSPVFDEKDALVRFEEEARVCSRMNHPNVVQVFDFDVSTRPAYIVFELIDGKNLKQIIKAKTVMALDDILDMMTQICLGLFHAHKLGIIHRDLKPANILIDSDGVPKIADFGLAKMGGVTSNKTKAGMVLGTPLYMSPEQAAERKLNSASDIYSFGVMLFELLGGAVPLDGPNDMQILLAHLKELPPLVSDYNSDIPIELDRIVSMLLEKDPAKRPDNAKAVAASLQKAKRELAPTIKGKMKVTLGRLRGKPRPKVQKRGDATTKGSAMVTDVASAILEKTSTTMLSHGRKMALLLCVLVPLAIAAAYLISVAATEPTSYVVTGLEVPIRGSRRAVLQWRGSWRCEKPRFKVVANGREVPVTTERIAIKKTYDKQELYYRHEVLLGGLRANLRHSLSLAKPDGSETLPRTFETIRAEPFRAQPKVSVTTEGELEVAVFGRTPFQCTFVPKGRRDSSEIDYSMDHRARFTRSYLVNNQKIKVSANSIDGDRANVVVEPIQAITTDFEKTWELFEKDYRKGEFFRYFAKGRRMNNLYHQCSMDYRQARDNPAEKERTLKIFWQQVHQQLMVKANWYRRMETQLAGLPWLAKLWSTQPKLALSASRALIPLYLINGAAVWYNVEENEHWIKALGNANHPFSLTLEKPSFGTSAKEFTAEFETYANLVKRDKPKAPNAGKPPLYMIAWGHPGVQRYKKYFEKRMGGFPSSMTLRRGRFDLGYERLEKFKGANLQLVTRSPWAHIVVVVDFVRSGFTAVFRESGKEHRWLRKQIHKRQNDKIANKIEPRVFSEPSEGDIIGGGYDDKYPDGVSRYHTIPMEAIVRGENPIEVRLYCGPIELEEKYSFFSMVLRLNP